MRPGIEREISGIAYLLNDSLSKKYLLSCYDVPVDVLSQGDELSQFNKLSALN